MKSKLLVANFKSQGATDFFKSYVATVNMILDGQKEARSASCVRRLVLAPPLPYLYLFHQVTKKNVCVALGAQDVSAYADQTITGEVSAAMLKDAAVSYVIIGHSERLKHKSESVAEVRDKINNVMRVGLTPIVCVGESAVCEDMSHVLSLLYKQIELYFLAAPKGPIIIAYEPLWAIGTNQVINISFLADLLKKLALFLYQKGLNAELLYGGSVNESNIKEILAIPDIGGVLVGRFALQAKNFLTLLEKNAC